MPSATMPTSGRQQVIDPLVTSKKVLDELFGPPADRSFAVRLWDGTLQAPSSDDQVPFTIAINRPGALRRMLLPPSELAIGEAFLRNDFDVEGDLEDATALADQVVAASDRRSVSRAWYRCFAICRRTISTRRMTKERHAASALPDGDTPACAIGQRSAPITMSATTSTRSGWTAGWSTHAATSKTSQ